MIQKAGGKALTTKEFLRLFGYTSLEELPELPRYKLDENEQIVIDDIIEDKKIEPLGEDLTEIKNDVLKGNKENLESAISGEHEEAFILYKEAAEIAKEEGFKEIADSFLHIINSEKHHKNRYQKLLGNLKNETTFKKDESVTWMCRKCGYLCENKCAPNKCPNCEHEQAYFQVLCENY